MTSHISEAGPTPHSVERECRVPWDHGNESDPAKKPHNHRFRSSTVLIQRNLQRQTKHNLKRQFLRNTGKRFAQLARAQISYAIEAQEAKHSKHYETKITQLSQHTLNIFINNHEDNRTGITHFLWKEEIKKYAQALPQKLQHWKIQKEGQDSQGPTSTPSGVSLTNVVHYSTSRLYPSEEQVCQLRKPPPEPPPEQNQQLPELHQIYDIKRKQKICYWNTKGAKHFSAREK